MNIINKLKANKAKKQAEQDSIIDAEFTHCDKKQREVELTETTIMKNMIKSIKAEDLHITVIKARRIIQHEN